MYCQRLACSLSLLLSFVPIFLHAQPMDTDRSDLLNRDLQLRVGSETQIALQRFDGERADIAIDGVLDEAVWAELTAVTGGFGVVDPETLADARYETEALVFYTDEGLYIAVDMQQPGDTLVQRFTGRDNRAVSRDRISVTLDTSGSGVFGYWFSLALGDNQLDGTILPERQYSNEWDGAWYGATAETENGWAAEFFIPWGQLAMSGEAEERHIGFYASRVVSHLDETWGWPRIAQSDPIFLSDFPRLQLEGVDPRQQWSLFPYASSTYDEVDGDFDHQAGLDVFWRPSSDFQLTATLNPDFGAAESDNVVVNLTATETFFPENRLFFQEGQEVFNTTPRSTGHFGKRLSVLNTRRIGGRPPAPELPEGVSLPPRERLRPADLLGAAKVTGQNGALRYGVMGAMEDDTVYRLNEGRFSQDGRDFAAVRLLYEDSRGATSRGLGYMATSVRNAGSDANVHAVDVNYLSSDGQWNLDGQLVNSRVDDTGNGYGAFTDITYRPSQGLRHILQLTYLDDTVDVNDFGFLDRNNVWEAWYRFEWIKTDLDFARNFRLSPFLRYEENLDGARTNNGAVVNMDLTLDNLDRISGTLMHFPKRYDDLNSFGHGTFAVAERTNVNLSYTTDESQPISISTGAGSSGEFAGGRSYNVNGGVTWRAMDNLNFSTALRYEDRDGWLLHQRDQEFTAFDSTQWRSDFNVEYFISARQQLTAALQWVGIKAEEDRFYHLPADAVERKRALQQVEKPPGASDDFSLTQMNFQLRYRWQIAPLSDLFVVYTKNDNRRGMLNSFNDQFSDAWRDPLVSQLVVKLRYRLGT